jgi:hypothetical protein
MLKVSPTMAPKNAVVSEDTGFSEEEKPPSICHPTSAYFP